MKYPNFSVKYILCAILFTSPISDSYSAQTQPQPDRVGRSVSGSLQTSLISRGFAANDPRFANTLARISPQISGAAGTAAAITIGTVTAPGWVSVALAIGIGTVVSYAVNLGMDSLVNWLFRSDGKIDENGNPVPVPTSTAMSAGESYWKVSFHSGNINIELAAGDGEAIARQGYYEYLVQSKQNPSTAPYCSATTLKVSCGIIYAIKQFEGAPSSCPAGTMYKDLACRGYTFTSPPAIPLKTGVSPQQAVSDVPDSDLDKKLNPAIVAALANTAWRKAASQPGYDGLPYPQSNPVTASDVVAWNEKNPQYAPTVNDFISPNPVTSQQPQPWALPQNPSSTVTTPATVPNSNTTNPAASSSQVNLGADPATPAPTLEPTPTALEILNPILQMLPDLKNFRPTFNAGTCPRPTLNLFGNSQTFEAHCIILENNKAQIHAAMVLSFSILAVLIVLSA